MTDLIDVFLSSPSETASIVTAEYEQWRVVGAGIRREDGGRSLDLVCVGARTNRVQQNKCGAVGTLGHRCHQRSLTQSIPEKMCFLGQTSHKYRK